MQTQTYPKAAANPLPALDTASRRALRESIKRFGAGLVPCLRDQYGNTVDGHNREAIAADLDRSDTLRYFDVEPDDPEERAAALVRINDARRQRLDKYERRQVVKHLREQRNEAGEGIHSTRAIAEAVGVSEKQVRKDLDELRTGTQLDEPERIVGPDGKSQPATKRPKVNARVVSARGAAAAVHNGGTILTTPPSGPCRAHELLQEWEMSADDPGFWTRLIGEGYTLVIADEPKPKLDRAPATMLDGILRQIDDDLGPRSAEGYYSRLTGVTLNSLGIIVKRLAGIDFDNAVAYATSEDVQRWREAVQGAALQISRLSNAIERSPDAAA